MEILEMKEDELELSLGLSIGGSFRKFEEKSSSTATTTTTMSSSITFDTKKIQNELKKKRDGIFKEKNGFDLVNNEEEKGSEQICKKLKMEDALNQNPNNHVHRSLSFPVLPMQFGFRPMQYDPFGNGFNFPYQMMPCWVPPPSTTTSPASTLDDKNVVQPIACKPVRPFQFSSSVMNSDSDQNVSKSSGVKDSDSSGSGANSISPVSGSQHGNELRSRSDHSPPPSDQLHLHDAVINNVHIQSDQTISSNPLRPSLVIKEANTNSDNVISSNTVQPNLSIVEEERISKTNPLPILNKPISNTDFPPHSLPPLHQLKVPIVDNYMPLKPRPPRRSKGANEDSNSPPLPLDPHQLKVRPPRQSKGANEDSNSPPLPLSPHQLKVPDEETNQLKTPNEETNQSPESKLQTQPPQIHSLSKMPCVSTIGDGPNGKTITGFLYRYTKTEVSIICVCHGTSFSPAEFVKHAGGTDVSHPLKNIVVVPSAFS